MELAKKKCVPCMGGIPPLTRDEAVELGTNVPQWRLAEDARAISRDFKFGDFAQALAFVNQVGVLAEEEGHHPDIQLGWGYASIKLYTHKINGLHENDFIMAAKINSLV